MFTVFEETWKDGEQAGRTGISCNLHKRDRAALLNYKCCVVYQKNYYKTSGLSKISSFYNTLCNAICMLLGIMLLTSCGKTDHQDQAPVATEQTSEDSQQTTESSEYAERKSIIITATNECGIDIGMFSVIDPISGEQYNISAIADGQSVSMPVEWPVEITDFQWALYNQNGELCVEATTDISQAESGVTLLLTGDGNLDDVQEIFE